MGADGHIAIFNYDKLEAEFGKSLTENFFAAIVGGLTYRRILPGTNINVITDYYGDNIGYDSTITKLSYADRHTLEDYEVEHISNLIPIETAVKMSRFLHEQCLMDTWEVWT